MYAMAEEVKASRRIQTSFLNAAEHRVLVWLAARQPAWVTSNILTVVGIIGSVLIGAGYQCTTQMEATVCVRPGLEEVYVSDLVFERAEKLAAMMSEKLGRQITPIADPREKCRVADIIITVTGAASPVIDADYLNPRGCLYINVGGYECTYDTVRAASRIVVDNWNAVKHRKAGTVARMADVQTAMETVGRTRRGRPRPPHESRAAGGRTQTRRAEPRGR